MLEINSKNRRARQLFDGIARNYEWPAQMFSLLQYGRWRNQLVSRLELKARDAVLDICTGPAGVALSLASRADCHIIGLDISDQMLAQAQQNIRRNRKESSISLVQGRAENLPFSDNTFDAVIFTFLLRYVEDIDTTLKEIVRVLRPGGQVASLEFYAPEGLVIRSLWLLHTRLAVPVGAALLSSGWSKVGSFLGPSISNFYRRHPLHEIRSSLSKAGISEVQLRQLSLGGAVIMWGRKTISEA